MRRLVLVAAISFLVTLACVIQSQSLAGGEAPEAAEMALLAAGATDTPAPLVCPTQPVIVCVAVTATPQQAASPSVTATRTPAPVATATRTAQATPSQLPEGTPIYGTNVPATPFCTWEMDGAKPAHKKTFYVYTDPQNSGLYQRIRSGPGTEFLTMEYLSKLERRQVYWSIMRGGYTWWALDATCHQWAAQLGSIEIVQD